MGESLSPRCEAVGLSAQGIGPWQGCWIDWNGLLEQVLVAAGGLASLEVTPRQSWGVTVQIAEALKFAKGTNHRFPL